MQVPIFRKNYTKVACEGVQVVRGASLGNCFLSPARWLAEAEQNQSLAHIPECVLQAVFCAIYFSIIANNCGVKTC
jgi:hypothetical protein